MRYHYGQFVAYRALAELKRDSANMYLGMLWWLLEPVLYMAVFYLIFGLGLRKGGIDYVFYLLCGLVPWKWIDSTVRSSSGVIAGSVGLMRQVYFPKWVLPGYICLANTYKFLIIFVLLLLFLMANGVQPAASWLAIPVLIFFQALFVFALAGLAAATVPLLPDLKYVVSYGMTMLFFLSGIFFDPSEMGEPVRTWLSWNPALMIISSYRTVLLYGTLPEAGSLIHMFLTMVLLFGLSMLILFRLDRYYPRIVS